MDKGSMARRVFWKFLIVLISTSAFTFLYWYLYGKPRVGIDDANIYFTYAKNLAEGHGFVFNAGGERVEGFTSLLWVLICSLVYTLFANFEFVLLIFNVILISLALFCSLQFIDRLNGNKKILSPVTLCFLLAVFLIPGYIDWTILTLMETGLWSLLMILIVVSFGSKIIKNQLPAFSLLLSFFIGMLVITRPESLLWGIAFIGLLALLIWLETRQLNTIIKKTLPVAASFLVSVAALTIFRIFYFGYPLPNTYYAKVSSDTIYNIIQGIRYYLRGTIQTPILWVITVIIVVSAVILWKKLYKDLFLDDKNTFHDADKVQLLLVTVSMVSLLIPIYTGGDHFKLVRFYQPYFPIYLMCVFNVPFWKNNFAHIVMNPAIKVRFSYYWLVFALVPLLYLIGRVPLHDFIDIKSPVDHEFRFAELGRKEGELLNKLFEGVDKPSIGISAAGGFGYSYEGETVDLMGLNNSQMAHALKVKVGVKNHAAFDINTFFDIKPDIFHGYFKISKLINDTTHIVFLENVPDKSFLFSSNMYKGIFSEKRFIKEYIPVVIVGTIDDYYQTYAHVDYIKYLKEHAFKVIEVNRVNENYDFSTIPVSGQNTIF